MSYGIEIRNTGGVVLIDGQYRNFHRAFRRSASFTTTIDSQYAAYHPKAVYFPSKITTRIPPLIAIRALSGAVGLGGIIGSQYNWTGFWTLTPVAGTYSSKSYSLEYEAYTFAENAATVSNDGYGMQVFSSSGAMVFDSRKTPVTVSSHHVLNTLSYQHSDYASMQGNVYLNLSDSQYIDLHTLGYYNGYSAMWPGGSNHKRLKLFSQKVSGGHRVICEYVLSYSSSDGSSSPPATIDNMGTHCSSPTVALVIKRK